MEDVVIVGGGMAGLSAAWSLVRAGAGRVRLFEREPFTCAHASGRNAAIFRSAVADAAGRWLAEESRPLLDALFEGREAAWLRRTGVLLVAAGADGLLAVGPCAPGAEVLDADALERRVPALAGGVVRHGLLVPGDGVMDIHAVTAELAARARAGGARLTVGTGVRALDVREGAVHGVVLEDGTRVAAGAVVLAAGAWAGLLGRAAGCAVELAPLRRHLVQLEGAPLAPDAPVVWRVDAGQDVYVRPEGDGALASPCDESLASPGVPDVAPGALELLAGRLEALAPRLAEAARVRRAWACLRTFTEDRHPVVGADAQVRGLWWLAGLGGHGMTGGMAAARVLCAALLGEGAAPGVPAWVQQALAPGRVVHGRTAGGSAGSEDSG